MPNPSALGNANNIDFLRSQLAQKPHGKYGDITYEMLLVRHFPIITSKNAYPKGWSPKHSEENQIMLLSLAFGGSVALFIDFNLLVGLRSNS